MYTFDSRIRYSEIDRSGRLSIPAVVDYFQDCSAFQSEELGVGVEYLANKKRAWILNSWQIVLERRPEECEKITVGTWVQLYNAMNGSSYDNPEDVEIVIHDGGISLSTARSMGIVVEE